jgi:alpha-beta hydrolase superfamily lysophospholipase
MVSTAVAAANAHPPDVMLGSSLGALVALAAAARGVAVPLLLLAPAVGFAERWATRLPPGVGPIPFHHFGEGREVPVHRAFFEETSRVTVDDAPPRARVVILMGRRDETIPFETVRGVWDRWTERGSLVPGSRYEEVADGDHGLFASVPHVASVVRELAGD